jgi:hypothetical protein
MKNRLTALTSRSGIAVLLLSTAAFLPATSNATVQPESFAIMVLDASYSTDLLIRRQVQDQITTTTRLTTSPTPIADTLKVSNAYELAYATASADTFSVSTETYDRQIYSGGYAEATAETALSFKALQSGIAPILFEFDLSGIAYIFGNGFVSLYDVTAAQALFRYSWEPRSDRTIPENGSLAPAPWLEASHTYALTLHLSSNAQGDGAYGSIRVSGLQPMNPIPEPEAYASGMVGFSVLWLIMRRRRAPTAT